MQMEVRLRPELAELVKQDVQRGPYQSVDEFVERAVSLLHEQESWLASNREEIAAKIAEGYAAASRGELIESQEVRSDLEGRKRARFNQQRGG